MKAYIFPKDLFESLWGTGTSPQCPTNCNAQPDTEGGRYHQSGSVKLQHSHFANRDQQFWKKN